MLLTATHEDYKKYNIQIWFIYFTIGIGLISKLVGILSFGSTLPIWGLALALSVSIVVSGLFAYLIRTKKKIGFLLIFVLGFYSLNSIIEGVEDVHQWSIVMASYYSILLFSVLMSMALTAYLNIKIFPDKGFFSL